MAYDGVIGMRIKDLIGKAFIGGIWYVGYRKIGTDKYRLAKLDRKGWIADPFLFEHKGEHYLFVEFAEKEKGDIAYFKFIKGKPVFQKIVISEPYHLSYPCVFEHKGEIYMIPESADNHSVDMYKAVDFPDRWEKLGKLVDGVYYDTTYLNVDGKEYLLTYSPRLGHFSLELYTLDVEGCKAELIANKQYKENVGRPAGREYEEDGALIRPAQDCSRKYGENLFFYKITDLKEGSFDETKIKTIPASEVDERFQRIHTYNRDSVYETVDFFKEYFEPFRAFKLAKKIIIQRLK